MTNKELLKNTFKTYSKLDYAKCSKCNKIVEKRIRIEKKESTAPYILGNVFWVREYFYCEKCFVENEKQEQLIEINKAFKELLIEILPENKRVAIDNFYSRVENILKKGGGND